MFCSITPTRFSMNWMSEVWSNNSELTQPPRLHGEMTSIGTRGPSPYQPAGYVFTDSGRSYHSPVTGTVDPAPLGSLAGTGATTWSKKPSFSSNVRMKTVLLHTSGSAVSTSRTFDTYQAP